MHCRTVLLSSLLGFGLMLGLSTHTHAAEPATSAPTTTQAEQWRIWGGEAAFRWNRSLLENHGVAVLPASGNTPTDSQDYDHLGIRHETALEFQARQGSFNGFMGGSLALVGGFEVKTTNGTIDLRSLRLQPRSDQPFVLDLVDANGTAWFYIDRLMYEIEGGSQAPMLRIKASDMRMSATFARFIGAPDLTDQAVANVKLDSHIQIEGRDASVFEPAATGRWPGAPVSGQTGETYQADVFMYFFDSQIMRQGTDYFDANGGHKIALAPSSTLRNNRNNGALQQSIPCIGSNCPSLPYYEPPAMLPDPLGTSSARFAADIAWYTKFQGNHEPYGNDQHPFLIWNLYRIDAEGRIEQIGRSGVKHAWLTTNSYCDTNPGSSHILGHGCVDTYSQGNNDEVTDLGPRSEVVPAKGLWGRCGSVYDRDCDGYEDNYDTPCSNLSGGNTAGCRNWAYRMAVPDAVLDPALNPGVSYLMESWYVARDDIDIYNTMQTRGISFSRSGSNISREDAASDHPVTGLKLGPAIDRWLARGTNTSTARSSDIATDDGQARLAVRATELADGWWRYDYVVANFDYAVEQTSGSEPNLRVISNTGFIAFEVDTAGTLQTRALGFSDGDQITSNNWSSQQSAGLLRWQPPSGDTIRGAGNTLDWGTMFRYSFESPAAPISGTVRLKAHSGRVIELETLVPDGAQEPSDLLSDDFEDEPAEA